MSDSASLDGRWARAVKAKLAVVQLAGARKQAQREAALQAARYKAIRDGWAPPKSLRPGKTKQVRNLHAKVKNQRKGALHKFCTKVVAASGAIFVGNVSSKALVKTMMAKSTLGAGWSQLKTMLEYKCHQAGVVFAEVNESWTTQTCNARGVISGPIGRAGLKKRKWICKHCSVVHDRGGNAALNIRRRGLAEGAPA